MPTLYTHVLCLAYFKRCGSRPHTTCHSLTQRKVPSSQGCLDFVHETAAPRSSRDAPAERVTTISGQDRAGQGRASGSNQQNPRSGSSRVACLRGYFRVGMAVACHACIGVMHSTHLAYLRVYYRRSGERARESCKSDNHGCLFMLQALGDTNNRCQTLGFRDIHANGQCKKRNCRLPPTHKRLR